MIYRRIARRYAAALFLSALRQGLIDQVEGDLESARAAIAADANLRAVLAHPEIPSPRKEAIIQASFAALHPVSLRFVSLLVRRRRHDYLPEVTEEYRRLADQERGLVRARVASSIALTDAQKTRLQHALERRTGKRVEARYEVDVSLLAGLVVNLDHQVIDASARGRLARMRELLAGARYRGIGQ